MTRQALEGLRCPEFQAVPKHKPPCGSGVPWGAWPRALGQMAHHCQVPPSRVSSEDLPGWGTRGQEGRGAQGPARVAMVTGWYFQGRERMPVLSHSLGQGPGVGGVREGGVRYHIGTW